MSNSYDSDEDENEIPDIKGIILKKKYIPIKLLYTSNHSNIWITYTLSKKKLPNNNYCVLKIYDNTDDAIEQALDEIKYTQQLANNPNVISIIDLFEHDEEYHCIIYPLLSQSLYDIIKHNRSGISLNQCKRITKTMLLTLQKIHGKGLLHMDIKPENMLVNGQHSFLQKISNNDKYNFKKILDKNNTDKATSIFLERLKEVISDDESSSEDSDSSDDELITDTKCNIDSKAQIYLIDFGSCIQYKDRKDHHTRTDYYMAPEDILEHKVLDASADLWALACSIFELLTGKILFNSKDDSVNGRYSSHLYLIQQLIGPPSLEYLKDCKNMINYYKMDTRLKGWDKFEFIPLYNLLKKRLINIKDDELLNITDFLMSILKWNPKNRPNIKQLLSHKWIN